MINIGMDVFFLTFKMFGYVCCCAVGVVAAIFVIAAPPVCLCLIYNRIQDNRKRRRLKK